MAEGETQVKWWKKKIWMLPTWAWILVVIVVASVAAGGGGSSGGGESATKGSTTEAVGSPEETATAATNPAVQAPATTKTPATVQPAPESELTVVQQNAVRSAESYLGALSFSRQGLIDQLSSEYGDQFPVADATIAVDSLTVDWSAEAVESARSYLDLMGFSCQGLVDQLTSAYGEKFTLEQANYATREIGLC